MLRNKDYVLAVWRAGSFSRAAERLFVSQPSLSATVKRVEAHVGAPLFDRSTSPISLTEIGEIYVKYALEIEEREQAFENQISDMLHLLSGSVRVGGSSLFSSFVLPPMISAFQSKHPQITFEISEGSTKNLLKKLAVGEVDIVIDNATLGNREIATTPFAAEMLLLAVPAAYAVDESLAGMRLTAEDVKAGKHLLEKYAVELRAFSAHPFICLNAENDTGKRAEALFKKHGIHPRVLYRLDQQVTAYHMSCAGAGISFISDTLIKHLDASPQLFYYRLTDRECARSIYFYTKANRYLSQACGSFIQAALT